MDEWTLVTGRSNKRKKWLGVDEEDVHSQLSQLSSQMQLPSQLPSPPSPPSQQQQLHSQQHMQQQQQIPEEDDDVPIKNEQRFILPVLEGMEIQGNGGPQNGSWIRSTRTATGDRAMLRTPESRALQQAKNAIQKEERWDDFKKITNPYEYVFLSWNRRSSRSVATRQPLSRSYFKMVEVWNQIGITELIRGLVEQNGGRVRTAHAAEGPGGFIEACWEQAERIGWTVESTTAITLRSDARNIPGWRKAVRFLADRPQIQIHEGADGTGNILVSKNQDAFVSTAGGAFVYTADGGFDFSSDYNAQEDAIFPLLLAEFIIGIEVLAPGGVLVIKCFDTTETQTLDLLWMASHCFREWSIIKPKTSRAGNAERYFIGKGRLPHVEDTLALLKQVQTEQLWNRPILERTTAELPTWNEWKKSVLEFQERVEHIEYEIIRKTLDLIHAHDFSRIRSLVRENIHRSIQWCEDNGEAISTVWSQDMERNVSREAQDLLHILSPPTWQMSVPKTMVSSSSSAISFKGFRTDEMAPAHVNPFTRYVSTGAIRQMV